MVSASKGERTRYRANDWKQKRERGDTVIGATALRVSTDKQGKEDKFSLPNQKQTVLAFAEREGITVPDELVFSDTKTSRAKLHFRPQFSRLLELLPDARTTGTFDVLIFPRVDRQAREEHHFAEIEIAAHHAGVAILYADGLPNDDSVGTKLYRDFEKHRAVAERVDIPRRTHPAKLALAANPDYYLPGPRPRFGYAFRYEQRGAQIRIAGLEENPDSAWIVRRIFAEAVAGKSANAIAEGLQRDGVPAPGGTKRSRAALEAERAGVALPRNPCIWYHATVRNIIKDETYIGLAANYRNRAVYDEDTDRYIRDKRPADEVFRLHPGVVPALVDEATFRAAQVAQLGMQRKSPRHNPHPEQSLLRAGYVFCHGCQGTMVVQNRERKSLYVCQQRPSHHTCDHPSISRDNLDREVWSYVEQLVADPERVIARLSARKFTDPYAAELAAIDALLAGATEEERNYAANLGRVSGPAADLLLAHLQAATERAAGLRERRATVAAKQAAHAATLASTGKVIALVKGFAGRLATLTYEEKRALLTALGVRVLVNRRGVEPRYVVEADPAIVDCLPG